MSEILSIDFQDKHSPPAKTSRVGQIGETLATKYLLKKGFRLVAANFKAPIGRNRRGASVSGEIDLVALDGAVLCFVEVKTRTTDEFAAPIAAVDLRKQRQIIRAARVYRKIFRIGTDVAIRYDAVAIVLGRKEEKPRIELFKNYWTEHKFRAKRWNDSIY